MWAKLHALLLAELPAPDSVATAGSSSVPSPGSTTRRRPLIRTDRRDDTHEASLALACCLICWRRLEPLGLPNEAAAAISR